MVDLTNTRVVHRQIGDDGPKLKDVLDVARASQKDGHIRAKDGGNGQMVIYGHLPKKMTSVFHKEHIDRQESGTRYAAEAFRKYAEDKPQAVKDLIDKLLKPFALGQTVETRMRNSDVLRIHEQVTALEQKIASLDRLAVRLHNGTGNVVSNFILGLNAAPELAERLSFATTRFDPEAPGIKNGMVPELRTGFALAILKRAIDAGGHMDEADGRLLTKLLCISGLMSDVDRVDLPISMLTDETSSPERRKQGLEFLADLIKHYLFFGSSYETHLRKEQNLDRRDYPPEHGLARVYIKASETNDPPHHFVDQLKNFRDLDAGTKLNVLSALFEKHLEAVPESDHLDQNNADDPRVNRPTNGQALAMGISNLLEVTNLAHDDLAIYDVRL